MRKNKKIKVKIGKWKAVMSMPVMAGVLIFFLMSGVGIVGALNGWFGGGGKIPSDTMTRGLVGYWNFDEGKGSTAYDSSGNGKNGTVATIMQTFTSTPAGGKWTVPVGVTSVSVLVVAGGGGGSSGGGGAGGYQYNASYSVIPETEVTVTVGTGGAGKLMATAKGDSGGNSVFDSITSTGGGGGGYNAAHPTGEGSIGGSGGGGGAAGGSVNHGQAGTTSQGNAGGDSVDSSPTYPSGGGGGSSGAASGMTAGIGTSNSISGSPVTYAVGGAGCLYDNSTIGSAGAANTGNGGGGSSNPGTNYGGAGGSGVVIVSYTASLASNPGKEGVAANFNGTNSYFSLGSVYNGVKSVEFWIKADSTTKKILDLNGTQYVEVSNGTTTATGWTSPTIYIDGVATTTLDTNWHHVVITSNTSINASAVDFGRVSTSYFDGKLDEVRFYDRVLSQTEIRYHYNKGAPVAYWKFDEGNGTTTYNSADSADNEPWLTGYSHRKKITINGSSDGAQTNYQMKLNVFKETVNVYGNTGGTITTDGEYTIHTFTTVGSAASFVAAKAGNVEVLIAAGGGGGGSGYGGGGGAGGLLYNATLAVAAQSYTVTVGDGGAGGAAGSPSNKGTVGQDSIFSSITAKGGGFGSAVNDAGKGGDGGSGGGSGGASTGVYAGGTATASPVQGNNGGSNGNSADPYPSGGGGGAGAVGVAGTGSTCGAGGAGVNTYSALLIAANVGEDIAGTHWIAGGGGGGRSDQGATRGLGGSGGGGAGSADATVGTAGTSNTGGGGGGGGSSTYGGGGKGGSGVVIIRCKTSDFTGDFNGNVSLANEALNWPNDIRFTKSDGITQLDYWVESTTTASSTVWVEFDSLPASSATFYMYYGNASASTASNITNTFGASMADDFEWGNDGDNAITSGGNVTWSTVSSGAGTSKISTAQKFSGTRSLRNYSDGAGIGGSYFTKTVGTNYAISFKYRKDTNCGWLFWHGNGTKAIYPYTKNDEKIYYNDGSEHDTGYTVTADSWESIEVTDMNWTAYTYDFWLNGTKILNNAAMLTHAAGNTYVQFWLEPSFGAGYAWVDNIIIRKWTTNEPTWGSWGGEENTTRGVFGDGTCSPGSGTCPSWTTGKNGTALSFDGANDYVQAIVSQSTTTVSFWMQYSGTWRYVTNVNGTYYVNGKKINSAPSPYPIYFSGSTVYIGKTGASSYFNGIIDDVRIYNYARTQDEIKLDYNAGFGARFGPQSSCDDDPGACVTNGLKGYWNFDERLGQTAYDSSDNKKNAIKISETLVTFNSTPVGGKWTVPAGVTSVKALVVAGGGGGGGSNCGGGGGGGGAVYNSIYAVTPAEEITVTVGGGGAGGANGARGTTGGDSVFGTITVKGGGGGGGNYTTGLNGGSGGGGSGGASGGSVGGNTIAPPAQGYNGGTGSSNSTAYGSAGGGGGGGMGANGSASVGGNGGNGFDCDITGSVVGYAGGGGGAAYNGSPGTGTDGGGNGARGNSGTPVDATSGTANKGGGGGGSERLGTKAGGAGGSGVVILSPQGSMWSWSQGKKGTALEFDGTDYYASLGNVYTSVKTVEFWIKADGTTKKILDLNGTQYVEVSSGAITATGWTSPAIYIDGVATTTLDTNWHHVVITSNTGINASAVDFGRVSTSYFDGKLDEVRFYDRALSQTEIRYHYNKGGPIAYWKFDEGNGTTTYNGAYGADNESWLEGYSYRKQITINGSSDGAQTNYQMKLNVFKETANVYENTGGTITTDGAYTIHTFTATGTFTVAKSGNVQIYVWGGGGAGGTVGGWTYGAAGGAGGAANGTLSATPGSSYSIVIGGGGVVNSYTGAAGGGGAASNNNSDNRYAGGGGGYSGVFLTSVSQGNALIIAGGGGGGGSSRAGTGNAGGGGGGTTGQTGFSPYDGKTAYGGNPGTQSAAGANASSDSPNGGGGQGALQGGVTLTNSYGGGGGGGYWGGSAGGYSEANTMGGGGGGSAYYNSAYVSSPTLTAASGITPGDSSNPLRGTAGNAGAVAGNGVVGIVIIKCLTSDFTGDFNGNVSLANEALNWPNDIRFTKSDGITQLDYWVESTTTASSTVWVEFDSLPASSATFYMYYGNASASTASNGINTFPFFDDFEDASLDGTKWTNMKSEGVTESGGIVTCTADSNDRHGIRSNTLFGQNYALRSRIKVAHVNNSSYLEEAGWASADLTHQCISLFDHVSGADYNGKHLNHHVSPNYTGTLIEGESANTWMIHDVIRNSTASVIYQIDNSNTITISTNVPDGDLPIHLASYANGSINYEDWTLVRKYTTNEPIWGTWGSEENTTRGIFGDGTCSPGSGTCPSWTTGKNGTALSFDGANDYVQSIMSQSTTTISFWMQYNGTWQYITNNNGTYYINGKKSSNVPSPYPIYFSGNTVYIGKTGASSYFNGIIDDVRIYNYARTQDEIKIDYNAGFGARFGPQSSCDDDPGACVTNGLKGYWNFDERKGLTAYDSSGNGKNGTVYPPWLNSYGYRKKITVNGTSDGTQTNYQIVMHIVKGSGTDSASTTYLNGKSLNWPNDIRFTKSDGSTTLDYWIESTDSASSTVWVEFDSIPAHPNNATFYIYYGKAGDASASNGGATFNFFDDFLGSSLDTVTNWNLVGGSVTVGNSIARIIGNTGQIISKATFGTNYRYRARNNYAANNAYVSFGFNTLSSYANLFYANYENANVLNATNRNPHPTYTTVSLGNVGYNAYNIFEVRRNANTSSIFIINDSVVATITTNVPTVDLQVFEFAQAQDVYSDWVFVSKFTANEPAWGSWSSEETQATYNQGKKGASLSFSGTSDYVSVGSVYNGVKSVEFWIKADSTTKKILDLNGTQYVEVSSGAITATDWTSPTIYIDGVATTTLDTNWHHVVITSNTGINASAVDFGRVSTSYFDGKLDEIKFYDRVLSQTEIRYHYNKGGPVAYWKFDEGQGSTAYDVTDNNNDGALYGGMATSTTDGSGWKSGKQGGALSFDGVNDYVQTSQLFNYNNKTIEFWLKPNNFSTRQIFLNNTAAGGSPSGKGFLFDTNIGSTISFNIADSSGNWQSLNKIISANVWHYVVGIQNNDASKMYLYIDGQLVSSGNIIGYTYGDNNLVIGARANAKDFNLSGSIDDVRIYNYVRTQEQIQQDYNSGFSTHFK